MSWSVIVFGGRLFLTQKEVFFSWADIEDGFVLFVLRSRKGRTSSTSNQYEGFSLLFGRYYHRGDLVLLVCSLLIRVYNSVGVVCRLNREEKCM